MDQMPSTSGCASVSKALSSSGWDCSNAGPFQMTVSLLPTSLLARILVDFATTMRIVRPCVFVQHQSSFLLGYGTKSDCLAVLGGGHEPMGHYSLSAGHAAPGPRCNLFICGLGRHPGSAAQCYSERLLPGYLLSIIWHHSCC